MDNAPFVAPEMNDWEAAIVRVGDNGRYGVIYGMVGSKDAGWLLEKSGGKYGQQSSDCLIAQEERSYSIS